MITVNPSVLPMAQRYFMYDMTMHCALIHRPAGHWTKEKATGTLTLDFDARHRRRIRLTADRGEDVLLDLPRAIAMTDGDGLQLEEGKWLKVW